MKRMVELRKMSNDQLNNLLNDIDVTLRRLRGKKMNGQGTNAGFWQTTKDKKARILTILNERKIVRGGKN